MKSKRTFSLLAGLMMVSNPASAQDQTLVEQQTAELNARAALYNAEAALANAKAAKQKAVIENLGLPSFENKTELKDKGGEMEAAMLTTIAVREAALVIGGRPSKKGENEREIHPATEGKIPRSGKYLILSGSEKLDFNISAAIEWELESICAELNSRLGSATTSCEQNAPAAALAIPAFVSALSAITGLLGNETVVTGVSGTADDGMLVNALAGNLDDAIVYAYGLGVADLRSSSLLESLNSAKLLRDKVQVKQQSLLKQKKTSQAALLGASIKRFEDFYAKITKPDDLGKSPVVQAILLKKVMTENRYLLITKVHKSGGSLINTKNLWTSFGIDPVKVSGGLIVSYAVLDSKTGKVKPSGILSCQTTLASLRKIQAGKWKNASNAGERQAVCN